jgi:hypothetical protein
MEATNMRTALILSVLVTLSLGISATAHADNDGAKAGSEFGYFVGTWKCDETWLKSPISEAYKSTSKLVASNDTDGVWIAWSYVQDVSAKNKMPPKGNDLWGYDPQKKTFLRVKADNFAPGHLTNLTSKGFVGDTVAWDGPVQTPGGEVAFKHTFKKLDAKTIEGKLFLGGKEFYSSKCIKQ